MQIAEWLEKLGLGNTQSVLPKMGSTWASFPS